MLKAKSNTSQTKALEKEIPSLFYLRRKWEDPIKHRFFKEHENYVLITIGSPIRFQFKIGIFCHNLCMYSLNPSLGHHRSDELVLKLNYNKNIKRKICWFLVLMFI